MFIKKLSFNNRFFFIQRTGLLLIVLVSNSSFISAQNEPRYTRMAALEASSEMKAYQKDLRSGAPFTEKHQKLLLDEGLPQLFIDGNRLDRAQVRQRLEKIFFESIADPIAYKNATDTAVKQLMALARSEQRPGSPVDCPVPSPSSRGTRRLVHPGPCPVQGCGTRGVGSGCFGRHEAAGVCFSP